MLKSGLITTMFKIDQEFEMLLECGNLMTSCVGDCMCLDCKVAGTVSSSAIIFVRGESGQKAAVGMDDVGWLFEVE